MDLDTWHEVFSTLQKNVLRTVMTAWGIFWATFMLVMMLGFGNGLEAGVMKNMVGFAANNVYVWGGRTSMPHAGLPPARRIRLDTSDVEAVQRLDGVEAVAPGIDLGNWREGTNVTYREKTANLGVRGETPQFANVALDRPYLGRFINDTDMRERRKVTVIGETARRMLFEDDMNPLGEYVSIRGVHFQVVGVMDSEQPGEAADRANSTVMVPFTSFQSTFNTGDRVGAMGVRGRAGVDPLALEKSLRELVATRHGAHPGDPQAVGSFNLSKQHTRMQNLFRGIRAFVWFVCVATLLAGALGVSNIMLISVKERTREFGVRKALGATPGSIVRLVLREAGVLTVLAGYLGLFAGVMTLELVGRFASGDGPLGAPSIDLRAAVSAMVVLAVGGTLAGVAPARHASRIHPVLALRSE
jgi:putative ABC transport system permease protein